MVPFLVGGPHDTGWAVVPFHGGGIFHGGVPPHGKVPGITKDYQGCLGRPRGADEACLRARDGPMLRGFVDALDR